MTSRHTWRKICGRILLFRKHSKRKETDNPQCDFWSVENLSLTLDLHGRDAETTVPAPDTSLLYTFMNSPPALALPLSLSSSLLSLSAGKRRHSNKDFQKPPGTLMGRESESLQNDSLKRDMLCTCMTTTTLKRFIVILHLSYQNIDIPDID